jgi:hypothetical protein
MDVVALIVDDWRDVATVLGGSAVIVTAAVAIVKLLAQRTIIHAFDRSLAAYKDELQLASGKELAAFKSKFDGELADRKADADRELAVQKSRFDRQLEAYKSDLTAASAQKDRVRAEVVLWAGPIHAAITDLRARLGNILNDKAYVALSKTGAVSPGWSITYEYLMPSTVFFFAQYFCWIRLLEEKLSFELFHAHQDKDAFFDKVRAAGQCLSNFPLPGMRDGDAQGDRQVFNLQQRAIGELLASTDGVRCMRYAVFQDQWNDANFRRKFAPLEELLQEVRPETAARWTRLTRMNAALEELDRECTALLQLPAKPVS